MKHQIQRWSYGQSTHITLAPPVIPHLAKTRGRSDAITPWRSPRHTLAIAVLALLFQISVLTGARAAELIGLGDLAGGSFTSRAFGVSADGSVVVGQGASASGSEAFRWTQGSGMVGLGDLAGGFFSSTAYSVSADGSLIVGKGSSASGNQAFIWDATNGMRSLAGVLTNQAVDLTGWSLSEARGVSADGLSIVGFGTHNGNTEAYLVRLNAVPLPPAAWLFGSGLLAVMVASRRIRQKRAGVCSLAGGG